MKKAMYMIQRALIRHVYDTKSLNTSSSEPYFREETSPMSKKWEFHSQECYIWWKRPCISHMKSLQTSSIEPGVRVFLCASFSCETWLIRIWDMTHSYMSHDSFPCNENRDTSLQTSSIAIEPGIRRATSPMSDKWEFHWKEIYTWKRPYISYKEP